MMVINTDDSMHVVPENDRNPNRNCIPYTESLSRRDILKRRREAAF